MRMRKVTTMEEASPLAAKRFQSVYTGRRPLVVILGCLVLLIGLGADGSRALSESLWAGAAKVDITNVESGPVNDRLYARALVLKNEATTAVLITLDVVAVGEIGPIGDEYLPTVRDRLESELGIAAEHVVVNASHCHGVVCPDVADRTVKAVKEAYARMVPVRVGAGRGREDRISANRRLRLKNGREADVRHAYSLPPDEQIDGVGPIDQEIGILRLDRMDGSVLAVVYNFACHPIQGVPSGGNTADLTGFSSAVIEENLGESCVALFVQGCAGDINPVMYKAVDRPRDAEPLGNLLGLSTLKAARKIRPVATDQLMVVRRMVTLPRADVAQRIIALETEQARLLKSLKGTTLNLKTFIPLVVKYGLWPDFPSYSAHRYLHDESLGRDGFKRLDAENRRNIRQYMKNISTMERLTRLQTNLNLLQKHHAQYLAAGKRTIDVEIVGLRVGSFVLVTFPGELTVQIGLNIKKNSPHPYTFVAGYTNGYIYYAPTEEQLRNVGGAQEDSDCILGPGWQKRFEDAVTKVLNEL